MKDTVYSILLEDQRTDMHYKVARYFKNLVLSGYID